MTPKEKAKDIVDKYKEGLYYIISSPARRRRLAICFALIAVDEILKNDSVGMSSDFSHLICDTDYWKEVKEEAKKPNP